jgi:hypothetical protein
MVKKGEVARTSVLFVTEVNTIYESVDGKNDRSVCSLAWTQVDLEGAKAADVPGKEPIEEPAQRLPLLVELFESSGVEC